MKHRLAAIALLFSLGLSVLLRADDPPREWVEPATGHRVVRLSDEPGTASLYFHQNPYTAKGDKIVVTTANGLATIDLQTRAIAALAPGRGGKLVVGRKTRQAYYVVGDTAYAADLDTRVVREIKTDPRLRTGSGFGLSADETLLAGSYVEEGGAAPPAPATAPSNPLLIPEAQEASLEARWLARRPMALYTLDVKTGEIKTIYRSTDWLNHVQMSPTDPALIMYCHEGPWHKVDRIWTIRTDGSQRQLMHNRTMDMEIAGHEFFRRPRARSSGWPALRSRLASGRGTRSSASTGPCTSISHRMGRCSPATAEGRAASPHLGTASGFISSVRRTESSWPRSSSISRNTTTGWSPTSLSLLTASGSCSDPTCTATRMSMRWTWRRAGRTSGAEVSGV